MANLVSSAFMSEYRPFEEMRGAAYYLFADGRIERNPRYPEITPRIRDVTCYGKTLPLPFPQTSLSSCIGNEESLAFLNNPGTYLHDYEKLYLFT
jgi:glucose-6-phosphate isomerase